LTRIAATNDHDRVSSPLVPCPSCGCHVKVAETDCPHCGSRLRRANAAFPRAAAAVIAGLTATISISANAAGCGGKVVVDGPPSGATGASGTGGAGGSSSGGGHGGSTQTTGVTVGDGVGGAFTTVAAGPAGGGVPTPVYGIAPIFDAGKD
jgi:hypothetical protein